MDTHAISPSSFIANQLKKVFSTQPTEAVSLELGEDEPLPNVKEPRDLIPYYRKRYINFRRISLSLTKDWRMYYVRRHNYEIKVKRGMKAIPPVTPKPTPKPPPIVEKKDFNGMDPPNANFTIAPSTWKSGDIIVIRYFKGNTEVSEEEVMYDGIDHPETFSFALIAVTTYSRLFFITHLLNRWQGLVIVLLFIL